MNPLTLIQNILKEARSWRDECREKGIARTSMLMLAVEAWAEGGFPDLADVPSAEALEHAIHILEDGPGYGHARHGVAVAAFLRSLAGGTGGAEHPNPDPSEEQP